HRYLGADPPGDELRFLILVIDLMNLNRHTPWLTRPELLVGSSGILADNVLGGFKNGGGTAVILLQLDNGRARKVAFEIQDIREVRAAPAVDRLPVIANHADVPLRADETFDDGVLRSIGILVLVDKDVFKRRAPCLSDCRLITEQSNGFEEQVVKVERPSL